MKNSIYVALLVVTFIQFGIYDITLTAEDLIPYRYQETLTDLPEEPENRMLSLSLKESALIALQKNFEIIVEKFTSKISETGIQNQKGTFDPTFSAIVSTTHENDENAVGVSTTTDLNKFSTGISKKFTPGLKIALLYETSDRDEISDEGRYNANLKLQVTQNLLKDFGININTARITIAEMEYEQSRETLAMKIIEIVADVQSAYWNYYQNQKDLEVRRKSYDLTKSLFNKKKQEAILGSLVPADLIEIESRVASKITEYIEAKKSFRESDVTLRKLLGLPFNFEGDTFTIKTENCPVYSLQQINFKKTFEKALENHPEYRKKQLQVKAKKVEVQLMKNQTLPDLEAFASYGIGSNKNSWRGNDGAYALQGGDNYEVGLKLSIPLGNNEAGSNYTRAWLELEKLRAELKNQELEIKKSISNAKISLEQNALLYQSGSNNLKLKEKNLKAGEEKLKYGTTTLRELLDIQTELINASLQLIGAEVSYEQSLVNLYKIQGTLDPRLNINLSDIYEN
jgi:outer membrane protein